MTNPNLGEISVLVEGFPDTELVKLLGVNKKYVLNSGGKASIGKKIAEEVYSYALAMVDEDPGKRSHSIYDRFLLFENDYTLSIKVKKYKTYNIIELCPDLERWILRCADKHKLNIEKAFKLPREYKSLHSRISRTWVPQSFHDMINYMLEKEYEEIIWLQDKLINRDIMFDWDSYE
jgi:hypothetical protein